MPDPHLAPCCSNVCVTVLHLCLLSEGVNAGADDSLVLCLISQHLLLSLSDPELCIDHHPLANGGTATTPTIESPFHRSEVASEQRVANFAP